MAQNKPARYSGRTGTVVKKIIEKDPQRLRKAAPVISLMARQDAEAFKLAIEKGELADAWFDTAALRHAFQKELLKKGLKTEKANRCKIVPEKPEKRRLWGRSLKQMNDEFRRRELRIKTLEERALGYKKPCPPVVKSSQSFKSLSLSKWKSIPEKETPFLKIKPDIVTQINPRVKSLENS
tara:strand:- start:222 stop:764 length:543 start_codon:yes stop_codon:yes gene_type:complete